MLQQHVAYRFRLGYRRWADLPNYAPCYCNTAMFSMEHILTSCPDIDYTAIEDQLIVADNGQRDYKETALEVLKLTAKLKYIPLARFYTDNEELLW